MRIYMILLLSLCLSMICSYDACAYLDPGTGSMVLQILAAALFASLFVFKSSFSQIKVFVLRLLRKNKDDNE